VKRLLEEWGDFYAHHPEVVHLMGPDHVVVDHPAEHAHRRQSRPIGFTHPVRKVEPLLWDGDQA